MAVKGHVTRYTAMGIKIFLTLKEQVKIQEKNFTNVGFEKKLTGGTGISEFFWVRFKSWVYLS